MTATDPGGLTAAQNVAVTVVTPNRAPEAVGSIPAQSLDTGETVTLEVSGYFRDPDGDALTYTAATSAAGVVSVSISGSSLTMVGVAAGRATVTVTATDPEGLTGTQSAAVAVQRSNRAPEAVGSIPAQSLEAGGRVTLDVTGYFRDPDGDALTYTAATSNAGVASVSISGSSLTVVGVAEGRATVTVTAADPRGLTAAQRAAVAVQRPNRAPEAVGSIPAQSLDTGETVMLDVTGYFRDPDGDALTYTAATSNAGVASVSMSGSSLMVTGVAEGRGTVTVTATDPGGLTGTQSAAVTVVTPNRAPEAVGSIPAQSLDAGGRVTLDVSGYFRDPDGDALTYTAATSNAGVASVSISGSSLTVVGVAEGRATVTVTAADPGGLTAAQSAAVTVVTPNRAPEAVGSIPAQSLAPGRTVTVDVSGYFRDPDGDALTYTAATSSAAVASVSISDSSLTVTGVAEGTATVTVTAADPGGLTAVQSAAVTVVTPNRAPEAVGSIPAQSLDAGGRVTLDVTGYFRDPDGDALTYTAAASNAGVASVSISGSSLTVVGIRTGSANVQVTAADPAGLTATQNVGVTVRGRSGGGGFGDGFDEPSSLNDWEIRNAAAEVVGGVLHLTNRVSGSLGLAERSSPPKLNQWTVSARVGRATRQASPGVASLTGHRRFSAARLVLRTLDNGGDASPSADVAGTMAVVEDRNVAAAVSASRSGGTGTNYELAIFDAERGWLQVTNLSGRSDAVDERPNAFTDIELGLDNGNFVARAQRSETGESETLFRVSLNATLDNVPLGDILNQMNGLWLVNQGPVNATIHIDDVVVTGEVTSNRAPVAVGSIPAQRLNPGQARTLDVSGYFRDPDGNVLTYTAATSNAGVASVSLSGSRLLVTAEAAGAATVTVTASDPGGLSAAQTIAVTVQTTSGDRAALEAFYEAAGGPNWKNNDGWLTDAPLADWYGVAIDSQGRVVTLTLVENNLRGEISPDLGNLANLEGLNLFGLGDSGNGDPANELTGEIPPELGNLKALRSFDVRYNQLSGEIPPEFGNLTALLDLRAAGNELTGEIPPELGDLTNLQILNIQANRLTGGIPAELGDLANLRELIVTHNELSGEIPPELGGLANLRRLWIGGNSLTGEIPRELAGLASLEDLHLWENELTGEIPPELGGLRKLRILHVNDNELAGSLPESFLSLVLDAFWWYENAALCAPDTSAFRTWLAEIEDSRPGPFCGENRAPEAVGTIPPQTLEPDGETSLNVSSYFRDPDGDALTYTASSTDTDVVVATMWANDNRILVLNTGVPGTATVTVTASDPAGLTATQTVTVTVSASPVGPTNLTNHSAVDGSPAWSPDGARIAFDSNRDGNFEIYVMNADGSGPVRLTNNSAEDRSPAWSPDGSRIAFSSNLFIYMMNADGSRRTQLTDHSASDHTPAWSPDGTKIAFSSARHGYQEIYVMNADGTGQTRLTNSSGHDSGPAWSPDGTRIAFRSERDGNGEIYVMNADGTGQTRLTNNSANDAAPAWSPEGTRIAFNSHRDGNAEIYVMNADGTGKTRLTNNSAIDATASWSPDGTRIAFHSTRDGNFEIYVMDVPAADSATTPPQR